MMLIKMREDKQRWERRLENRRREDKRGEEEIKEGTRAAEKSRSDTKRQDKLNRDEKRHMMHGNGAWRADKIRSDKGIVKKKRDE